MARINAARKRREHSNDYLILISCFHFKIVWFFLFSLVSLSGLKYQNYQFLPTKCATMSEKVRITELELQRSCHPFTLTSLFVDFSVK